jgi:uncharacterized protein YkwD
MQILPERIESQIMLKILLWILLVIVASVHAEPSGCPIEQQALSTHNYYRHLHHAPPLIWDKDLAAYAKKYAQKCQFKHSQSPYGENLAAGFSSVAEAISAWHAEEKNYSYQNPQFIHGTGHFTQLVWKSTKRLGCCHIYCGGKNNTPGNLLVCEYSPAGNIINEGYFQANVLPQD